MRANLFYLLVPGIASFIADIAALIAMGGSLTHKTENTLLWAFGISGVAWFATLLTLKHYGPEYGPPPETTYHGYDKPAPKPIDTSRTRGMDPDTPGDEW